MKTLFLALILANPFILNLKAEEIDSALIRTRSKLKIIQVSNSASKSGDLFTWSQIGRDKIHSEARNLAKLKSISAIVDQCNELDGNLMMNTIQSTEINPEPARVIMVVSMICEY